VFFPDIWTIRAPPANSTTQHLRNRRATLPARTLRGLFRFGQRAPCRFNRARSRPAHARRLQTGNPLDCREHGIGRIWLVTFMRYDLGYFDDETCRLEPIDNSFF